MATFSIPLPGSDEPYVIQSTSLEGRSYLMTFDHNSRKDRWTFSLANEDGTEVISGVQLSVGVDLLESVPWTLPNVPPGFLYVAGIDDPTLATISEVSLIYIESTDSPDRS